MKKVLFTGVGGILGKYFSLNAPDDLYIYGTYLHNKPKITRNNLELIKFDITKKQECQKIIDAIKPDVIVHAAAQSNVDVCEKDKKNAYLTNFTGTVNLLDAIKNLKTKFIFASTSNVFSGKSKEYNEKSKRTPLNYYGYTKSIAEDYIRKRNANYIIIRPTTMYGWNYSESRPNLATSIIGTASTKRKIRIVNDRYTNFVDATSVAKVVTKLIKSDIHNATFHIGGRDCVSYYDFALKLGKIFSNLNIEVEIVNGYDLRLLAARPKKLCLKTSLVENILDYKPIPITVGLERMLNDVDKQN